MRNKLTALAVATVKEPGFYGDGDGLYLQVRGASKCWIYRFKEGGRLRCMGLGSFKCVSLAEARRLALEARRLRMNGINPIIARHKTRLDEAQKTGSTLPAGEVSRAQLYRQFDRQGRLLYVGISLDYVSRTGGHNRKSPWFSEVAAITLEHFATKQDAEAAEYQAITTENPRYNVHGGTRVAARRLRAA